MSIQRKPNKVIIIANTLYRQYYSGTTLKGDYKLKKTYNNDNRLMY